MFAEISDAVWLALIGLLAMCVKEYIDYRRAVSVVAKVEKATGKVAEKVEEVHKATNSLTDRLVATTKTEAHAAGVKEEKDKSSNLSTSSTGASESVTPERSDPERKA